MKIKTQERLNTTLEIFAEICIMVGAVNLAIYFVRDTIFGILWGLFSIVIIGAGAWFKVMARDFDRHLRGLRMIYPYEK